VDQALDPDRPLLGQLLWSADPATQNAITLVWVTAALALLFVYGPLLVRLVRVILLDRAVREACQLDDRPAEAHREEIATAFARSPLEAQWDDFAYRWRRTRNAAPGAEGDRAPVRLLDVFEDRPIVPTGAIKSLLPAVPGLFLAVGVLGTFVGLVAAVGAGAAADGAPAAELVADRVGLALRSSLWGLILAMAAVVGGRLLDGAFERLADSLDQSVERAFGALTSGELASLSARAQREALGQLGNELRHFASDLTERMDRGLQRIEHSTASAANLVSEEQRSVLQSVVRELSVQVQTGVEHHLSALHEVLERAVDHQGAVTGGLAEAFDQMGENARMHARVTQTLEQAARSVEDAATSMTGTAHDLGPVLDHLRATSHSLAETAAKMDGTQAVVSRSADGIRSSMEYATGALYEQRQFIETGLQEIRTTLEHMSTGLGENLERALRNVDEALEHTVGRLRETIEGSNETIERLSGPVRAAEGTTREMQTALERVHDEVVAVGDWMGQAVKPLRAALAQIEDRAQDVTRALAAFGDRAQHVDKTMDALRGEIHEEGRRYRTATAELTRHLQVAAEAAGALQQAAASARTAVPASTPPLPAAPSRPTSSRYLRDAAAAVAPHEPAPEAHDADGQRPVAWRRAPLEAPGAPGATGTEEPPGVTAAEPTASRGDAAAEGNGVPDGQQRATGPAASGASPAGRPRHEPGATGGDGAQAGGAPVAADGAPAARDRAPAEPSAPDDEPPVSAYRPGDAEARAYSPDGEQPPASPRDDGAGSAPPRMASRGGGSPGLSAGAAGKLLGPDPYARDTDASASYDRQRRLLESGRSMHDLETDPEARTGGGDTARDTDPNGLSLSGLLRKPAGESGPASSPGGAGRARGGRVSRPSQPQAETAGEDAERPRPRTWKLLGKE